MPGWRVKPQMGKLNLAFEERRLLYSVALPRSEVAFASPKKQQLQVPSC
jgi:hypothetical protein